MEILSLNAPTAGAQIDRTLEIAGFDAPTAGFHRDQPLEVMRVHTAAACAHTNLAAGALDRDSSRAILQLYITTGWHGDLEIDSAQTKLEDAPGHAARDVQHVAMLVVVYLHALGIDANAASAFGRGHAHHALFTSPDGH